MASEDTQVVTGRVRLGYVHLFEPYTNFENQPKKYSCSIAIPKSDKKTIGALKRARAAAIEDKWGSNPPKKIKTTIKDGDEDADLEKNPELEGCYYLTISSPRAPGVVDRARKPILDETEVYSGIYAHVAMNAFAYGGSDQKGVAPGVSFGLNHVMKVADGEALGGMISAESAFADLELPDDDEDDEDGSDLL